MNPWRRQSTGWKDLFSGIKRMIYHVAILSDWEGQELSAEFKPPGYEVEGFIHCCTRDQLSGVIERYYSNYTDFLLLHIDESRLNATVKYEKSTSEELFPHVFGPINKESIIRVTRELINDWIGKNR